MQTVSINRGNYTATIAFDFEHTIITSLPSGEIVSDQVLLGYEPFHPKGEGLQIVIDHKNDECFKTAGNPSNSLADFTEERYNAWARKRA